MIAKRPWLLVVKCIDCKGRIEVFHKEVLARTSFGAAMAWRRAWPEVAESFVSVRIIQIRPASR